MSTELLLQEDNTRFVLFPIKYPEIWKAYEIHKSAFWTAQEIDYPADLNDWGKLTDDERYFIENILGFFAGSDGIVLENLISNFCSEIQIPEVRCFYSFQGMIENIHSEVYSLLIDTFIKDKTKKNKLFNAIDTIPCVKQKAVWAIKWMDTKKSPFAQRLIAFAIVEGLFFSGSFCAIFWLKNRGIMTKALGTSNELISRDEGMHTDFAILLYGYISKKIDKKVVQEMFKEAVKIETNFITESLPCKLIGMNSELMIQYIKFVADRLLTQLGYEKLYNSTNPFPFMDTLGLDGKTNFFEKRVTEYQLASQVSSKENRTEIILVEDF
jgi:ribonucleoside-diphosphate reductase beta chain